MLNPWVAIWRSGWFQSHRLDIIQQFKAGLEPASAAHSNYSSFSKSSNASMNPMMSSTIHRSDTLKIAAWGSELIAIT